MKLSLLPLLLSLSAHAQVGSISSMTANGPLVLSTFDYTAGAFCSVKWNGLEFIDANDHGRCLQSAMSVDWLGEGYNPTEAGSSPDGNLPRPSSSKVMNYVIDKSTLATEVRMAFWNPVNGVRTSNYVHRKWVQVGIPGRPNVIRYEVAFEIPADSNHGVAQKEWLTAYLTPSLKYFFRLSPQGVPVALSDGPGEQDWPLIFSNETGSHAIGVVAHKPLSWGGYGRWRPAAMGCAEQCTKWNVVSRTTMPKGTYRMSMSVSVNTFAGVVQDLMAEARR